MTGWLESWTNKDILPVASTGSSESKEYKDPSSNYEDIHSEEEIYESLDWVVETDKEDIIKLILNYDKVSQDKLITTINEWWCTNLSEVKECISLSTDLIKVKEEKTEVKEEIAKLKELENLLQGK